MNFRLIKQAIVDILLASAVLNEYEVITSQRQKSGSKNINDIKKVAVFFISDDFDTNSGTPNGDVQSNPTFEINLKVSSKGLLVDENDPATLISSEIIADDLMDEFFDTIYQILMDARNLDLGLPVGTISKRFIKNIRKGDLLTDGDTSTILGSMNLTCQTAESVSGDEGVIGVGASSEMTMNEDEFSKTKINIPVL